MADSEKSRTLPPVTRRGLLSGTKVWLIARTVSLAADTAVLALWREWFTTCGKIEELFRLRKRAEFRLVAAADSPLVEVPEPGCKRAVTAFAASDVDSLLGRGAGTAAAPTQAKPARRACKQVWMAMDKPRRFIADIAAKPDAAFFTDASGQHRTNDRKLEMAMASRS